MLDLLLQSRFPFMKCNRLPLQKQERALVAWINTHLAPGVSPGGASGQEGDKQLAHGSSRDGKDDPGSARKPPAAGGAREEPGSARKTSREVLPNTGAAVSSGGGVGPGTATATGSQPLLQQQLSSRWVGCRVALPSSTCWISRVPPSLLAQQDASSLVA